MYNTCVILSINGKHGVVFLVSLATEALNHCFIINTNQKSIPMSMIPVNCWYSSFMWAANRCLFQANVFLSAEEYFTGKKKYIYIYMSEYCGG
jgi:hypothetical protein